MSRVYRVLAVALLVLGLLVVGQTIAATISDVTHTYSPNAIKCTERGCRSILADGSLADGRVVRPEGGTR